MNACVTDFYFEDILKWAGFVSYIHPTLTVYNRIWYFDMSVLFVKLAQDNHIIDDINYSAMGINYLCTNSYLLHECHLLNLVHNIA